MADRISVALEREARIRKAERRVQRAVVEAMDNLAVMALYALEQSGMDPGVLDVRWPDWSEDVAAIIEPEIAAVFETAYEDPLLTAAGEPPDLTSPAAVGAANHLATVRNRLVGVGDDVFALIRTSLDEGRAAEEGIPELSKRVEATLAAEGQATWKRRGVTIARTEVIAANNAGSHAAASDLAGALGERPEQVAKEWLATHDTRTRKTHQEADGETVIGMATPFEVGASVMQYPGDPAGAAKETINCRCTVLYHYPGDPDYPPGVPQPGDPAQPLPISMEDAALEDEAGHLMGLGDFNDPRLMALMDELDQRDRERGPTVVDLPTQTPDAIAEQAALNKVLFGDGDPPGLSARRAVDREKQIEDEFYTWMHTQWLRAEEDTRGVMLTKEAVARGNIDPQDIISRRLSQKWATPEFQEWLAQPGNQSMSFPEFRASLVDDKKARAADWRRRNRGWESEYG